MSEDEDDLYDDEDDSIFEDDDEEYEDDLQDEDEESEDDLYDDEDDDLDEEYEEYEEEYEDEEEASDRTYCFVCSLDDEEIPEEERWKFAVAQEDGSRQEFWTCKSCRDKFGSLEDFDEFRSSWVLSRIYQVSSMLQRAVLWKAPEKAISELAFLIVGALFNEESMKTHATEELNKLNLRLNQTGSDR